jgi:hypothetical protein
VSKNNVGNIISKKQLFQAKYFHNNATFFNNKLLNNTTSNTSTSINEFRDVGQKRRVLKINNSNIKKSKLQRTENSKLQRNGLNLKGNTGNVGNKKLYYINKE